MISLFRMGFMFLWLGMTCLASGKLLSFLPSMEWDGIDGRWSTFELEVGTPAQTIRLLPGTSTYAGSVVLAVASTACSSDSAITNCTDSRGSTFASAQSQTWSIERLPEGGHYKLENTPEKLLGLEGSASFGFDTVGFPCPDKPILTDQLVAAYGTDDFWIGSLGLSPRSFRAENCTEDAPTLLRKLYDAGHIGSLSWAYTAGAFAQSSFASLTLGGYDSSRFDENNSMTAPIIQDTARDMIVSLRALTYDTLGSTPLVQDALNVLPDSMVPHLWLPVNVCERFEQAFNLTWDEHSELYLLDESTHAALVAQNPIFTFELASPNNIAGNQTAHIDVPYSFFDLNVGSPLVDSESRYFPLKRAHNETQYTLGRVFFQAAHVMADYDRSEFSIAQALFPADGTPQNLVSNDALSSSSASTDEKRHLETGQVAGIAVGAAMFLVALSAVAGTMWYRRRSRGSGSGTAGKDGSDYPAEEKTCSSNSSATSSTSTTQAELSSDGTQIVELHGNTVSSVEMENGRDVQGSTDSKRSQQFQEMFELAIAR